MTQCEVAQWAGASPLTSAHFIHPLDLFRNNNERPPGRNKKKTRLCNSMTQNLIGSDYKTYKTNSLQKQSSRTRSVRPIPQINISATESLVCHNLACRTALLGSCPGGEEGRVLHLRPAGAAIEWPDASPRATECLRWSCPTCLQRLAAPP